MPSKTKKQARFMAGVAHGWKPSRVKAPPKSVAKDFNQADKGSSLLSKAMVEKTARSIASGKTGRPGSPRA